MIGAHVLIEIELCSEESEGSVLSANLKGGSSFGSSVFSTRNRFVFDTVCSVHCNFKVQTDMISWLQDLFLINLIMAVGVTTYKLVFLV